MKTLFSVIVSILLISCGDSQFADLPASDLQDRYYECENSSSMSPGAAITCDNIRRECKRRAKKMGRTMCF